MADVYQPDSALMDAVRQEDTPLVLSVVRAFHAGHLRTPRPPSWDIHDLEQGRGAQLVQALKAAVDQSYISGMILLLDPHRVQRVLQTYSQSGALEGVEHLKFIAAVFEDNTDGIAQVWRDFVLGGAVERSVAEIIDFLKTYVTASENYLVGQQRQRLRQAVGEHSRQLGHTKKM